MAAQVLVCSAMASLEIDAVKELLEGVFSEKATVMIQQPDLVGIDEKMGQLPLLLSSRSHSSPLSVLL
jgi:hypothetical protein